jgi:hypothetical protein
MRADSPSSSINVASDLRKLLRGDVGRTKSVPNLSPLLIEVVGVAQCSGRRRKGHPLLAEERRLMSRSEDFDGEAGQRQSAQTSFALGGVMALKPLPGRSEHLAGDRQGSNVCVEVAPQKSKELGLTKARGN